MREESVGRMKDIVERMIELFPGVKLTELAVLVDSNCEQGASRGGVETALMKMVNVSEDDKGGLWIWENKESEE